MVEQKIPKVKVNKQRASEDGRKKRTRAVLENRRMDMSDPIIPS